MILEIMNTRVRLTVRVSHNVKTLMISKQSHGTRHQLEWVTNYHSAEHISQSPSWEARHDLENSSPYLQMIHIPMLSDSVKHSIHCGFRLDSHVKNHKSGVIIISAQRVVKLLA